MGTDIHVVWQKQVDGTWRDIPSEYQENRHYFLFAWLAGVRNGVGFAGVKTGEPVTPISEPRGLPEDFLVENDNYHPTTKECMGRRLEYYAEGDPISIWMGDHSYSWFTLDEIINADRPYNNIKTGIITIEEFYKWDRKTPPESYSGGIFGPSIKVAESVSSIDSTSTHVRIEWINNSELDYFIDEVKRLRELHGPNTRMVFGFDS